MKRSGFAVLACAVVLLARDAYFINALIASVLAVWLVGLLGPRSCAERAGVLLAAGTMGAAYAERSLIGAALTWALAGAAVAWALHPRQDEA